MLDIVRYALTGGDRVIDEVRKTVLQRAYLPDGHNGVDFYAHPDWFPRKILRAGVREATPFAVERHNYKWYDGIIRFLVHLFQPIL